MTTKAKAHTKSILDAQTRQDIKQKMEHSIADCWRLIYTENKDDPDNHNKKKNRSSTKTDGLHKTLLEALAMAFGTFASDFLFLPETANEKGVTSKIHLKDLYGSRFNLDGMIAHKNGPKAGKLISAVLLKAPMQSIQKNRFNGIANENGECLRVCGPEFLADPERHLLMVPISPIETFTEVKGLLVVERSQSIFLNSEVDGTGETVLDRAPYSADAKSRINEIPILYSLVFPEVKLASITNRAELEAAIATSDEAGTCFIKLDDRSLEFMAVYFQNFLARSANENHLKYLSDNKSRLRIKPRLGMSTPKLSPTPTPDPSH